MSLPFGFSPFDGDYDSPYASTNAAIRRQSRNPNQQTTPTSSQSGQQNESQQQQQHQQQQAPSSRSPTRPSSRRQSQVGDSFPSPAEMMHPARRYSPPPQIPAAEDFGSKRFSKRSPSGGPDLRAITQPQPMGAPLAAAWAQEEQQQREQQQQSTPHPTAAPAVSSSKLGEPLSISTPPPPAASQSSTPASPTSPTSPSQRRPPPPPPASRATSPPPGKKTTTATPASPKTPPPPATSNTSRWSWRRGGASAAAAATATAAAATNKKSAKSTPASPPAPAGHDLPEPAAPPAPDQVARATPAEDQQEIKPENAPAATPFEAQEMRQIGSDSRPASPVLSAATDSDDIHSYPLAAHEAPTAPSSPQDEYPSRTSSHSQRSNRRDAMAAGGAAVAAAGGAAALASTPSNSRPPHTAYNMGDYSPASPFNEKTSDNPREPLSGKKRAAAGAAAGGTGAGASLLPTSSKRLNEGSRFGNDKSYSAAGGAGSGGALARSWRNHKKAWIIGGIIALVIIIAAAVGGAVGSNSGSSGSGSSKGTTNGGGNGADKGTGSGGTGIKADSRLHNSFYGINYVPFETVAPGCGANITGVVDDLKLLSQLTTRIRLSGSACNETALVLDAIDRLGVKLTVFPTIVLGDSTTLTSTDYTNQVALITSAMDAFGTSNIGGVQVGEEYITNVGSQATLLQFVTAFRNTLAGNAAYAGVPVGTAETTSTWTQPLVNSVDFVFANNQAWYSGLDIDVAAGWTGSYFTENIGDLVEASTNQPPSYISETGWPSGASTAAQATLGDAVASVANMQTFLDTFICQANANGTGYFYFEMFDDPNQDNAAGGVGGHWGLFDNKKNLKAITIPDCSHR